MSENAGATTTTDHGVIRRWIEERDGVPAHVRGTEDGRAGVLRIDFEGVGAGEDELEHLSWEDFFHKFEDSQLAFLHQDRTADGSTSRFFKFVDRG